MNRFLTLLFVLIAGMTLDAVVLLDTADVEDVQLHGIATRRVLKHNAYDLRELVPAFLKREAGSFEEKHQMRIMKLVWDVCENDILKLGYVFHDMHGYTDIDSARSIIQEITSELKATVEADPLVMPYLAIYPVPITLFDITIRFLPSDCSRYPFPGNVGMVTLSDGVLRYDTVLPTTFAFRKLYVEPY